MEEEIDLRRYIGVLIAYWKWILAATVLAATTALAVGYLSSPIYEASALVVVTRPRYVFQFDSRVQTVNNIQPVYRAYPELATSDDLLQALLERSSPLPQDVTSLEALRRIVEARPGADPSLVRLSVRSHDPVEAARIANIWAELYVPKANQVYSAQGEEQQRFFEDQLAQISLELETAQQALIAFQARNRSTIISNQLDSYRGAQAEYLASQRAISNVIQDIQGLRHQLQQLPAGRPVNVADQVTALLLQIKAYNAHFGSEASVPLQLQIDNADTISNQAVSEQITLLDNLVGIMQARSAEIDNQLAALEPQILEAQRQLQEVQTEENLLVRRRDVAQQTYMTLAHKLEEARIAAQDISSEVQLASHAAVPERPVGPRTLRNTALAGLLGALLGILSAFALAWWREGETVPGFQKASPDSSPVAHPVQEQSQPVLRESLAGRVSESSD